jgi:hypothetical protein
MVAEAPTGLAAGKAGVDFILGKLTDPAFNEALSPAQGLQVTPHIFSSVEQEGRWKSDSWGYNQERDLTNPLTTNDPPALLVFTPPPDVVDPPETQHRSMLLDLQILQMGKIERLLFGIAAGITVTLAAPALTLMDMSSIGDDNRAAIDVTWWDDGLEIWGGYAGLAPGTKGFGSVFGHRAKIDVTGCTYGNYLPARYLIVASGWVNPVGPQYYEFRCGAMIRAGRRGMQPLFSNVWDREGHQTTLSYARGPGGSAFLFQIRNWATSPTMLGPT